MGPLEVDLPVGTEDDEPWKKITSSRYGYVGSFHQQKHGGYGTFHNFPMCKCDRIYNIEIESQTMDLLGYYFYIVIKAAD